MSVKGLRRCEAETKAYTRTGRLFDPDTHQCQNSSSYLKEISVEDVQKVVDANEKLVKELKDGNN